MANKKIEYLSSVNAKTRPWPWHKAWSLSLLHPNPGTWVVLSSDGNITYRQAIVWIIVTSLFIPISALLPSWIRGTLNINPSNPPYFLLNIFLPPIFLPLGALLITRFIHILGGLFGEKKSFTGFFIIYASILSPIFLLTSLSNFLSGLLRFGLLSTLNLLLEIFGYIIATIAIKDYFRVHGLLAAAIHIAGVIVFVVIVVLIIGIVYGVTLL